MLDFKSVNEKEWNNIIEESEEASIFHALEWLSFQKDFFNLEEKLVIIKNKAIFPVFIKKKGIFRIIGSPVPETGAIYCGIAFGKISREEKKRIACKLLDSRADSDFKIGMRDSFFIKTVNNFDPSMLADCGFEVERVDNIVLNLEKSEEELWKNMNKKARNAIRKAEKSNVIVEFFKANVARQNIAEYYAMVAETAERNKILPLPQKFYELIFERLADYATLALAFHGSKSMAGAIFLNFKNNAIYFDGASKAEYKSLQASSLVQWEFIKKAKEDGIKVYDLGGAGIERIAKFKEKFGGERVYYYRAYKEGSLAKAARKFYAGLRERTTLGSKVLRR